MTASWARAAQRLFTGGSPRARRAAFTALVAVIALLGAAHVFVRTSNYGAALTNDAMDYVSTAENLASGNGLKSHNGRKLSGQPPLFPIAMAMPRALGMDTLEAGRLLNIGAFGLTIFIAGRWLLLRLRSGLVALGAAALIAASLTLSDVASSILTESMFVLFTLAFLIHAESFLNGGGGRRAFALSAGFAALAALTRYAGVAALLAGALFPLMQRNAPIADRLLRAAAYGAISSIPFLAAYIYMSSDDIVGGATFNTGPLTLSTFVGTAKSLHIWIFPTLPANYAMWALTGAALAVATAFFIASHRRAAPNAPQPSLAPIVPFAAFAAIYLAFVNIAAPLFAASDVYTRYLAPIYAPLVIAAALLFDAFIAVSAKGKTAAVKWALAALIAAGCLANAGLAARRNLELTAQAIQTGYIDRSFNTAFWDDSNILAYARANFDFADPGIRIYSNDPNALRWLTDAPWQFVQWIRPPASITDPNACRAWLRAAATRFQSDAPDAPDAPSDRAAYIVWIGNPAPPAACAPPDLPDGVSIKLEAALPDGAVYRATQR